MNLGRAYYNLGQYDQSISWFSKVDQKSPVFIDSLLGKGWSFIKKEDYKNAIDQAYGLLAFSMKNSFQPEVPLIVAMAAISSCNYASAIDALKIFHKEYDVVYGWLYRWNQIKTNPAQAYNLHQMLKKQMNDKNQKLVPEKVISQWLNSIAFIQAQKELNLISDEDITIDQIREKIRSNSPDKNHEDPLKRSLASTNLSLSNGLSQYQTNLTKTTDSLIQNINGELAKINESLIQKWLRAYENSRMIEIEIFTSAKTAKLLKTFNQKPEVTAVKGSLSTDSQLPVLDWGRYKLSDNEDKEIWEDEIGAIHVDLTNQCKD
jgi:tetratricopeptide (TPR) repeat protein